MRKILIGLFLMVGAMLLFLGACLGLVVGQRHTQPATLSNYDTLLVLGSKIEGPSVAQSSPGPVAKNRLDAAIKVAQKNPKATIIVSGFKGPDTSVNEAEGMAHYLIQQGINADNIIKESTAKNTFENIQKSKKYFRGKVLLVTSDFHMARSLWLAKKQQLYSLTGLSANTTEKSPLILSELYLHETLGMARALLFGD